jgi:hypothetical protein
MILTGIGTFLVQREVGGSMQWEIPLLTELQRMKQQMDRTWNDLFFEEKPGDEEIWQWIDKLPKFEGLGRRTPRSRPGSTIR